MPDTAAVTTAIARAKRLRDRLRKLERDQEELGARLGARAVEAMIPAAASYTGVSEERMRAFLLHGVVPPGVRIPDC